MARREFDKRFIFLLLHSPGHRLLLLSVYPTLSAIILVI